MDQYQSLIGRQWQYGVNDCFSLVRDFYAFKGIVLPDFDRPADFRTCHSIFLQQAERIGFQQVTYDKRRPDDVLIMRIGTKEPMHAAVLLPNEQILHQRQDSLSAVESLRQYHVNRIAAVFRYAAGCQAAG